MANEKNTTVQYYSGEVRLTDLFSKLKELITKPYEDLTSTNTWEVMHEPTDGSSITFQITTEKGEIAYIQFSKYITGQGENNHVKVVYGDDWDDSKKAFITPSLESFLSFGLNSGSGGSGAKEGIFKRPNRTLMKYQLSMNNNYIALVIQGDPTFDFAKYYNSFLYFGRIIPFNADDENGNIALTCSSSPQNMNCDLDGASGNTGGLKKLEQDFNADGNAGELDKKYGIHSSKGMKDISMLRTYTGLPFQKHLGTFLAHMTTAEILTNADEMFSTSKWTEKYHASPVYVSQARDGYRGYFENVIVLDPENLLDTDVLREEIGKDSETQEPIYAEYKPIEINKNNPQNFINQTSPNKNFIIAIRKK